MWPYNTDERIWLVPAKERATDLPQPSNSNIAPIPANDDDRDFDPQIIVRK